MKKLLFIFFVILLISFVVANIIQTNKKDDINIANIDMQNTIKYWDYIKSANKYNDWYNLKLDKKGNATYQGKTVLTVDGLPLNDKNAYTYPEIKTMFHLRGIKPHEGCDPNDTVTNGELGCYIEAPENYSEIDADWIQLRNDIYIDMNSIKKSKYSTSAWFKLYPSKDNIMYDRKASYELVKYDIYCSDKSISMEHSKSFDEKNNLIYEEINQRGIGCNMPCMSNDDLYYRVLCKTKKGE